MSPTPFQSNNLTYQYDHPLVKQENETLITDINNDNNRRRSKTCPPSLKVHKDSCTIKKSSSSSSTMKPNRGPVIIYTHPPKVIHTNPKDFMSLVQKLTGMNRSEGADFESNSRCKRAKEVHESNNNKSYNNTNSNSSDDNDSYSSVITDENCSSSNLREFTQVLNSCLAPPLLNTQPVNSTPDDPFLPNLLPYYNMPSSSDLLYCGGIEQPLYDYMDVNFSFNHTN